MQLREEARTAILAAGDRARYRRGAWIFAPGDPPGPAMLILSGMVDVVETIDVPAAIARLGPGELFGEMAAIDGLPRSAGAVAHDDVEVTAVDPIWFNLLLTDVNGLAVDLLRELTGRMRRLTERVVERTDARVGHVAQALVASVGGATRTGVVDTIDVGHVDLAERAGLSMESTSIALGWMRQRGIIATSPGKVHVRDEDALRRLFSD